MKNILIKALQGLGIVVAVVVLAALMVFAMLFGPDASDDARLEALEEDLQEEAMNRSARRAPAEPPTDVELSEEEISSKYREAKSIEDNWIVYAEREAASILDPKLRASGTLYQPEKNLGDALEIYIEIAGTETVAIDDVVRVARLLINGDPIDKAHVQLAKQYRKDNEPPAVNISSECDYAVNALLRFVNKKRNETVRVVLVEAAALYRKDLLRIGFNPEHRYRSAIDFLDLPWDDKRRKVTHCGQHVGHVNKLAELTAALETNDQKTWALHVTDATISNFCCDCTGESGNELANETAYQRYMELGDYATAKRVARAVASENLELYAQGWEPMYYDGPAEERPHSVPILLPEHIEQAKMWYKFGGYDEGTIQAVVNDRLRRAAKDKAEEKRYDEALSLYRQIGDKENTRKMELLAGPDGA